MVVRTLVVSEARFVREALAHALSSSHHFDVLGAVPASLALSAVDAQAPEVALLHLGIPAGPELARAISVVAPRSAIIALGVREDDPSVVAWAEAGVAGYAPPHLSLDQLAECVRMVVDGGAACTPTTAAILLRRVARGAATGRDTHNLTAREGEIAELIAAGLSNNEIARSLSISVPTVKNHVHHILGKLDVNRRYLVRRELRLIPHQSFGPTSRSSSRVAEPIEPPRTSTA